MRSPDNRSMTAALLTASGWLLASCAESPPPAPAAAPAPVAPVAPVAPAASPAPAGATADNATAGPTTPDADFRKQAPGPGPEPTFKLPPTKRFKLKNGLTVELAEAHELPIVDVHLIVKTGGAANPKGQAGLADLTANMLDEGTKTRTAMQIADDIAQLGASLGTGASWDSSSVTVSALSKNVDKALEIWADVLQNPIFDEKEYTRVRDNLVTALTSRKDSPPAVAGLTFSRVLYPEDHPFAWPQSGTEESVKRISVPDMKKFYEAFYRPNNAVLIVAGDITEAELKGRMEKLLKDWKPKKVAQPKLAKVAPLGKSKVYLVDKAGAPQSSIRVGLVALERTSPDYFAASIMNLILGGGFYRLDLNLREGKGWTYGARSSLEMRRSPGPFSAGGEFVAAHTAESVSEILKEIKGMRDSDVTDEELRKAKDQVIKSFPSRFSTLGSMAGQLAELAIFDLPDTYWDSYTKSIEAVTKADVRRAAEKYLQADKVAIVVVGDQKSNEEALKKIADVEIRDLDGKLAEPTKAASN